MAGSFDECLRNSSLAGNASLRRSPELVRPRADKAIADYTEAIRLDPTSRHALHMPCICLDTNAELPPGGRRFNRGHPTRSLRRIRIHRRGWAYYHLKQFAKANADFEQAAHVSATDGLQERVHRRRAGTRPALRGRRSDHCRRLQAIRSITAGCESGGCENGTGPGTGPLLAGGVANLTCTSGSVGALGEQSPKATRPASVPLMASGLVVSGRKPETKSVTAKPESVTAKPESPRNQKPSLSPRSPRNQVCHREARRAEGLIEEGRKILLGLGRKKLGEPDERVLSTIAAIGELDRLNLLIDRILDAPTWADLLGAPDH